MSGELRARIGAIIRLDLAQEAAAGFPLLRRFPNSEIAGVPGYFARLSEPEREALLDALAHYSTLKWSHEIVREKKAHAIPGPYLARLPSYPEGDWYGARPRKSLLKRSVRGHRPRRLRDLLWPRPMRPCVGPVRLALMGHPKKAA